MDIALGKNVPIPWDEYFLILNDRTRREREKTFNPGSGTVSVSFNYPPEFIYASALLYDYRTSLV